MGSMPQMQFGRDIFSLDLINDLMPYVEQHFRTQLNASGRDVILGTRLARVRTLLESSNLSIGEIISKCGFANESHLSVLFKKSTGLSMRDYRKQNREPPDD